MNIQVNTLQGTNHLDRTQPEWYETNTTDTIDIKELFQRKLPEEYQTIPLPKPKPDNKCVETKMYEEIEEFIKNRYEKDIYSLSPYSLHAQISGHYYDYARDSIKSFFKENKKFTIYGNSSSHMRSHHLYRSNDNIIYVVHLWCQKISDVFYFSRSELETYFEDGHMDSAPDFNDPSRVSEIA